MKFILNSGEEASFSREQYRKLQSNLNKLSIITANANADFDSN